MKILVACESSGIVREAFRAKGHEAYSCDLLESEDNSPFHLQKDCLEEAYSGKYDMMIAHPPCTYLASSGLHWNGRVEGRQEKTEAPIQKICIENPIGCIGTRIRKCSQIIQPWQFGHDASKATCLWLIGLPVLDIKREDIIPPKGYYLDGESYKYYKRVNGFLFGTNEEGLRPLWGNQTPSGQNKLGPSELRWKERSRTYVGIAKSFAEQWG